MRGVYWGLGVWLRAQGTLVHRSPQDEGGERRVQGVGRFEM